MTRTDGGNAYRVSDNGPGIPAELLDSVFEPLVKGDDGRTGIGLAIVRKIIESYGGWIEACNDGGACFDFGFGAAPVAGPQAASSPPIPNRV